MKVLLVRKGITYLAKAIAEHGEPRKDLARDNNEPNADPSTQNWAWGGEWADKVFSNG